MVRNCNVGAALVLATLIFLQASINSSTAGILCTTYHSRTKFFVKLQIFWHKVAHRYHKIIILRYKIIMP